MMMVDESKYVTGSMPADITTSGQSVTTTL